MRTPTGKRWLIAVALVAVLALTARSFSTAWAGEGSGTTGGTTGVTVPTAPEGSPSEPLNVSATAGISSATVTWDEPVSVGASAITSYTIRAVPVDESAAAPSKIVSSGADFTSRQTTITGLDNGKLYRFGVTATNSIGTGAESALSNFVLPAGAPGAPTLLSVTAGNGQLTAKWTAPASDGGSPITSYRVEALISDTVVGSATVNGAATEGTVSGLTNGQAYTVGVFAINAIGETVSSSVLSGTPVSLPSAPTLVAASPRDGGVDLTWGAPFDDGGATIIDYLVTIFEPGNESTPTATSTSATTSKQVLGLTNGTTYIAKVQARNSNGLGEGGKSARFTPATVPGAPFIDSARAGDARIVVAYRAPASDGGSAVTGYVVRVVNGGATTTVSVDASTRQVTVRGLTNDAVHTVQVAAVNAVGTSAFSGGVAVTPTAVVPAAPKVSTPAPLTNAASSTLTVTTVAPDALTATTTDLRISLAFTDGSGSASTTLVEVALSGATSTTPVSVPLPSVDGPVTIMVFAVFQAGADVRVSPGVIRSLVVDATAPAAPSVAKPTSPTNAATVALSVAAEPHSTIKVTGGASPVSAEATGASQTISVPLTLDSTNNLSVTATDAAGNTSAATAGAVVQDSTAPAAPIVNAATATSSTLAVSNVVVGAESGATVRITGGLSTVTGIAKGVDPADNITIEVPLRLGAPGSPLNNELSLVAIDPAGNVSSTTAFTLRSAPVSATPDPPIVSVPVSPTNLSSVTLRVTAPSAGLEIKIEGGASVVSASSTIGPDLVTVLLTPDATNNLKVRVLSGVVESAPVLRTVVQDSTPPGSPTVGTTPSVTTASAVPIPVTGVAGNTIRIVGGAGTAEAEATGAVQLVAVQLVQDATNALLVSQIDAAGNESAPVSVNIARERAKSDIRGRVTADDLTGAKATATTGGVSTDAAIASDGSFTIAGLTPTADHTVKITGVFGTYFFDVRQPPANTTASSSLATLVRPGAAGAFLKMSVLTPPAVTGLAGGGSNASSTALVIQGTGLGNATAAFLVSGSRTIRLGGVSSASTTQVNVTIQAGTPADTYNVRVRTTVGLSPRSSASVTVTQAALALPVVTRLSQVTVPRGSSPVVMLSGTDLSGATGVTVVSAGFADVELSPARVNSTTLDVTIPATLQPGAYQLRVTTPNGQGPLSPSFDVAAPVDVTTLVEEEVVSDPLGVAADEALPAAVTFTSEEAVEDIETARASVELPEGLTFVPEAGQVLPDEILPPRPVPPPEALPTGAVAFSLGAVDQQINLSVPAVMRVDVTATSTSQGPRPLVYLVHPGGTQFELAGVTGTVDGVSYEPGGTILSETELGTGQSIYVIGMLLEHFSNFAVTDQTGPGAPGSVTASGGNEEATVTWTAAPANDSVISLYNIKARLADSTSTVVATATTSPATLTVTVTGLTNGVGYLFEVFASSSLGDGPSAFSSTTTPQLGVAVTGTITLQGVATQAAFGHVAPSISLTPSGGGTAIVQSVASDGTYAYPAVTAGTYTALASAGGYVTRQRLNVVIGDTPVVLPTVELRAGLVNNDSIVNILDISAVAASFLASPADRLDSSGRIVDVNGDGIVNILDISATASNFLVSSPQTWP